MKIAFTIATNNYLPSAGAVAHSFLKHNPDDKFVIFLLDKLKPSFNLEVFSGCDIREVDSTTIRDFDEMASRYTLFELITAIKPSLALNLMRESTADGYIFIDSDTLVYSSMVEIDRLLEEGFEIILSTHFFNPLSADGCFPDEKTYLNCGLHNAGLFAFKQGENTLAFLEWWEQRLKKECIIDFSKGLFYEQIWLNFVPQYFEKVNILTHPGYNVGYWNFHERHLSETSSGDYMINNDFELVMFHFSGFDINTPELISKYQNRYSFGEKPEYKQLFLNYTEILKFHRFHDYANEHSYYLSLTRKTPKDSKVKKVLKHALTRIKQLL